MESRLIDFPWNDAKSLQNIWEIDAELFFINDICESRNAPRILSCISLATKVVVALAIEK